jgi:CRP-like cAMP-binding protein
VLSLSAQSLRVLRDRVPLFSGFDDRELSLVMAQSRRRVLTHGEEVIAEGTLATKLFIVVSGEVAVCRTLAGRSESIARLKPGSSVGEIGIVDRAPRSAQVVATGETVILEIEHRVFEEADLPLLMKLYRNLASILAGRLRGTNDMLDMIAQRRGGVLGEDGSLVPSLRDVSMAGVYAQGADFSDGNFTGANFENATFEGAVFRNASFRGADLAGVSFDEDYMIGVDEGVPDGEGFSASDGDANPAEPDSLAASLTHKKD